ncbi:hypothetical protein C2G38_2243192 [Gigaspora rosea]|uniref:Uncharacterized protein n=1 Tax=Gigaspora rosea TaxID=44941 RepID=A0A397VJK3_9GLOM|nr:hypothetical protein C2G38_2243192 [Gigaspora rosea]
MQPARVFAILILIVQLTLITPSWTLEKRVWPRRPISEVRKRERKYYEMIPLYSFGLSQKLNNALIKQL